MSIFRKSIVGMEIDSTEIRVVNLQGASDKPMLVTCGRMSLQKGVVKDGRVQNPKLLYKAILQLWEKNNIKCRNVILGLNNQDIIVRFAVFPKVPEDRIDSLIRFQSEDYIPIPLEEIELDYAILGEDSTVQPALFRVLLVAARKEMLFDYISVLQEAKLNVIDIGASMLSLEAIIPNTLKNVPLAIINLSNDAGSIVINDGKEPGFARIFSYNTVIHEIIKEHLDNKSSSEYKMEENKVEALCEYIAEEIRSSVLYYQNQQPDVNLNSFAITGGISCIIGLAKKLTDKLEADVSMFGYLDDINLNYSQNDRSQPYGPDFAVCTSLALRGLEE